MKTNYYDLGFVKTSTCSPVIHLAHPKKNILQILELFKKEVKNESLIVLFPELSLTGYTCEDLFLTDELLQECNEALVGLTLNTIGLKSVLIVGHPFQTDDGKLYNCASVIYDGKILGVIPKTYLPNYKEFYEKRWFSSGKNVCKEIKIGTTKTFLSANQVFKINEKIILGIEICEDLWSPLPPSTNLALNGANVICNLSASNELVGKSSYRKDLINNQSSRLNCAYLYSSASIYESSKDIVFSGHCLIVENGTLLAENTKFLLENSAISAEIDIQKLNHERIVNKTFGDTDFLSKTLVNEITIDYNLSSLSRKYSILPFLPKKIFGKEKDERCAEILEIQVAGLSRRVISTKFSKMILGLSGGLDSTLALIVALETVKKTGMSVKDIICVSMPGFGTSERTRKQAESLATNTGVTFYEIDIKPSVIEHFKAISHDENNHSVVYENAQARERTQILFDLANQHGAFVLGTGDMTEIALGFATFNGDHMSNYGVNSSIPKTLVRHLVSYYKKQSNYLIAAELQNVLDTKISPELLPTDKNGNISQSTEDIVGPYLLHDFFLYHYLRNGCSKEKIQKLAEYSFQKTAYNSPEVIAKWLDLFVNKFKKNQFKRSVMPAGVKVGSVSLSPRGDWRMPDEVE